MGILIGNVIADYTIKEFKENVYRCIYHAHVIIADAKLITLRVYKKIFP